MKTDFFFKGLMVPVYTPFNDDKKLTVNYDVMDKYAYHLKSMGMHGVMILGLTGEGMTLTLDERKKLTEKWFEVTRKYDLKMLVHIGGLDLPEVYEFAEFVEKMKVDGVLLMPDLFYKPKTPEDLMLYMKDIMLKMPTRPTFYYHIPMMTDVYLDMYYFMKLMEKETTMFAGLFWADDRIDKVVFLKEKMPDYLYIIAPGSSILGYMGEGFDAFSMTAMNIFPELIKQLYEYMLNYKLNDAYLLKKKLTKSIFDLWTYDSRMDWMTTMKLEMDKLYPFKMGPIRKPYITFSKYLW